MSRWEWERAAFGGDTHYPSVRPIPESAKRPFWSIMIPTWERVQFLAAALRSVLAQDQGREGMQIEVVDNASTSAAIGDLVRSVGKGRIGYFRQPRNVGMSGNWTTCIQRARGRWVHILHDDDKVMPGFYNAYETAITAEPDLAMAFCRVVVIDERDRWLEIGPPPRGCDASGVIANARDALQAGNIAFAPSVVVRRSAYESAGGFAPGLSFSPDWEMWARIASFGKIVFLDAPLAFYRIHPLSASNMHSRALTHMREIVCVGERIAETVDASERPRLRAEQHRLLANILVDYWTRLLQAGQYRSASSNALWALRYDPRPITVYRLLRPALKHFLQDRAG